MMKRLLIVGAAVLSLPLAGGEFVLVRDHQPEAVIVRDADASGTLDRHIEFFNAELSRCAKTALPVVKEAGADRNRIIFRLEKRPITERDAFAIDFPDARTLRITGTEDSVRWAFNHLLEQEIGIRWLLVPMKGLYGPEINHYPQLKDVVLKAESFSDRPAVSVSRAVDWRVTGFMANWNGFRRTADSHMTAVDVFPVYKYAENSSWPQEILPVIDGKKLVMKKPAKPLSPNPYIAKGGYDQRWQPCWSHPETARLAIENILENLKKNPQKEVVNLDINDNGGCCQCGECLKAVGDKRNMCGYPDYSELYWGWVNKVADAVTKQYPDVLFSAFAYTEVLNPPSFKLNPRVFPRLCIELSPLIDPVWGEKRLELIRDWCDRAEMLDLYDYMRGIRFFLLPRIYFRSHSRILADMARQYKLRGAYLETDQTAFQGPQQALILKMLWNPDTDVEAFLEDWCEHAVGKKAAPYLREYYQRWEDYWTGEDIRKTAWYKTVRNAYMQLGECNTHTYALKKGDLKKFRALMEKVVELAETPEQKNRAQVLMQAYEYSELAATAAFSEIIPPEGRLLSADNALELLEALPEALQAAEKFRKHPLLPFNSNQGKSMLAAANGSIGLVIPFLNDPKVRERAEKYSNDPAIPATLRAQFKIWLGFKADNLIENGSFEEDKPLAEPQWTRPMEGERDDRYASDGKYAFRTGNGYYVLNAKMEPDKNYLFLCDVYLEKGSGEGRFSYHLGPAVGQIPQNWFYGKDLIPTGGTWNTYSAVVSHPAREGRMVDNLIIRLWLDKFESNEPVWIDNLRLYCLDDFDLSAPPSEEKNLFQKFWSFLFGD